MAKRAGIGVLEFAIGMGPRLLSRKKGETIYSLRAFPFGGFVKLAGMDERDEAGSPSEVPPEKNFYNKSVGARFLTISAGSVMNLLLGFVIFMLIYSLIGVVQPTPVVRSVVDGSPAAVAGLTPGDRIVTLNDRPVRDLQQDFLNVIAQSDGTPLSFTVRRNGTVFEKEITPVSADFSEGRYVIGVMFSVERERVNPFKAAVLGLETTGRYVTLVFKSLGMLFGGEATVKDMAGPIGIIQFASFGLDQGLILFFEIIGMISVSLGVINLFPFPVLDGGHLMFLLVELFSGKPVSRRWEIMINNLGAALLIALMVFIVFNDIRNWKERTEQFREFETQRSETP